MTIVLAVSLVGAFLAGLIAWIIRDGRLNERRKREPFATCDRCGYDLTSSTGTCPECGRVQPFFDCGNCNRRIFGREAGRCPFCGE